MKQKKISDILYVFQTTPYVITEDTDAKIIKVQEESYPGFVKLNPTLEDKLVKYNYKVICVNKQEWMPYINADDPVSPELAWSANSATVTIGADDNVFPILSNPHSVTVTYGSSDTTKATINASTGAITLAGAGNTTISATFAGNDTYYEQTVSYTLTVQEAQPSTYTVTLSGTDILQNATVKMDAVTVSTQSQYQNVADGTVVDVYPTGSVADYTLVSGATWSTDHWTATVNGADLSITINYAHDYSQDYLTLEALEPGTFTWTDSTNNNSINYSLDNGSTWNTLASGSSTPSVNTNDKVLFKASGLTTGSSGIGKFSSSGTFNASGNIMSLTDGDNFVGVTTISNNYQFYNIFRESNIVDVSNLILQATTLAEGCYMAMFYGCTSLTTAPSLPATTLANSCYCNMFFDCTSLTTAPSLQATKLRAGCYEGMFNGCTSLTTAPSLPATTLVSDCYMTMFDGCSSLNNVTCLAYWSSTQPFQSTENWLNNVAASGTFTKNASMQNWTSGKDGIPSGWTVQDYSA